ncbi:hypothetical protein SAMN04488595_1328 [Ralstonia sp. 25mfcol4.1]|nr:hypothetical protein SAMN04488595_1328 [Ralstonia sp. 25mfcol4.1]
MAPASHPSVYRRITFGLRGLCTLGALCAATGAASAPLSFIDPEDGQFDASDYLLTHKGALPVPIVITEPAVGYGAGLGLLFFSESLEEARSNENGPAPPNITFVGGLLTQNGTWGAFLGHFHTWDGDRYRYLGGLAKVDAQLDYFGVLNQPRAYELSGAGTVQQFLARIGDSRWYVGPRYVYFDATTTFRHGSSAPELGDISRGQRIGMGAIVIDYDSRDNFFYASRGTYAELELQFARPGLGSSDSFDLYNLRGYHWMPIGHTFVLGLRGDSRMSSGQTPFYAQPYVDLRGVQKGRYQDRNALVAEAELRWNVTPRWSVLGFSGVGKAYGHWNSFSDAQNVVSVGAGFRYLVARKLGVAVGIDVAHSKGQNAFYIQIGSAWR